MRPEVTRVEAHANTLRSAQVPDDRREVLESVAERSSLARRVLEQDHRLVARPRLVNDSNRVGDQSQRVLVRSGGTRAGMNHDAEQAEGFRAIQFVDEGDDRLLAQNRKRGGEVDQVTGV